MDGATVQGIGLATNEDRAPLPIRHRLHNDSGQVVHILVPTSITQQYKLVPAVELWFYVPLDTKYVISVMFTQANLLPWHGKQEAQLSPRDRAMRRVN